MSKPKYPQKPWKAEPYKEGSQFGQDHYYRLMAGGKELIRLDIDDCPEAAQRYRVACLDAIAEAHNETLAREEAVKGGVLPEPSMKAPTEFTKRASGSIRPPRPKGVSA